MGTAEGQDAPGRDALARDLAAAIDLPTAKERSAAARALAARPGPALADWLAAARGVVPSGGPAVAGSARETVSLPVEGEVESTRIEVHVPEGYAPGRPAPLLLALHGAGGQGEDVLGLWRAASEALGMIVVAPTEAGRNEGYRFSARERAAALAALRWARRRFDVDEDRIFASGISRGGHLAWDVALRRPDVFAALAPMIGGPRVTTALGGNNLRYVENLVAVPIRDLQGAQDDPHLVANVRLAFERLKALGAKDARLLEFPERGHDFAFGAVDWVEFLGGALRGASAARVVRRASSLEEARSAWLEVTGLDASVGEEVQPIQPPGWDAMGDDARRRFVATEAEKRTARLVVERRAPGRFEATSTGVRSFRLLLPEGWFEAGKPVVVLWNGRTVSKSATPSKAVLLRDVVERFDRRFLPVAELPVP